MTAKSCILFVLVVLFTIGYTVERTNRIHYDNSPTKEFLLKAYQERLVKLVEDSERSASVEDSERSASVVEYPASSIGVDNRDVKQEILDILDKINELLLIDDAAEIAEIKSQTSEKNDKHQAKDETSIMKDETSEIKDEGSEMKDKIKEEASGKNDENKDEIPEKKGTLTNKKSVRIKTENCDVGMHPTREGCLPCPRDTYNSIVGARGCIKCPDFKQSPIGSTSTDQCYWNTDSSCVLDRSGKRVYAGTLATMHYRENAAKEMCLADKECMGISCKKNRCGLAEQLTGPKHNRYKSYKKQCRNCKWHTFQGRKLRNSAYTGYKFSVGEAMDKCFKSTRCKAFACNGTGKCSLNKSKALKTKRGFNSYLLKCEN